MTSPPMAIVTVMLSAAVGSTSDAASEQDTRLAHQRVQVNPCIPVGIQL
jgi:hypothetical protein